MTNPRIVFAGTPEFALASLAALVDGGHSIVAVYTQPDRPAGRGRQLTASPVKRYAEEQGIEVLQPQSLKSDEAAQEFAALNPDVMIVAAYGLILPQRILDIPTHGCLNVHASVLPRWRGAAPIQAAILAGDKSAGISLMKMTAGLDCGPVYTEASVDIAPNENAGELHDRLAALGAERLVAELPRILGGLVEATEQDDALATYAAKIQKQDAQLDWTLPADELRRRVRAYNPVPGAYFFANGDVRVKVWQARVVADVKGEPGSFVQYDEDGVVIACGDGGLRLESLQLPGKRRASSNEFVKQLKLHE